MEKFKNKSFRRLLSMLLCLAMLVPNLLVPGLLTFASAESSSADTLSSSSETIVIAGSDFQNSSGDSAGATVVTELLTSIKTNGGYDTADGFLFAGDYSYGNTTTDSVTALQGAVDAVYPGLSSSAGAVYVQGNHDVDDMVGTILSSSGAHDADGYGVYVINEKDYMWYNNDETTIKSTAAALDTYLDAKVAAGYTKPIFVVSHLPLHYSMRTKTNGDTQYANYIFDVLNAAGAKGLNIIFLFGHDHSNGWDDYLGGSAIYLAKGDNINIAQASRTEFQVETLNFTYMNAGYVGYYAVHNDGVESDLTMTVFKIVDDDVTIARYSADGIHDLKSRGVTNSYKSETGYDPDTRVYTSTQTVVQDNKILYDAATGVATAAPGISALSVAKGVTQMPSGYTAYQTYDIKANGFTTGDTITITIPVDESFDTSRPVLVIDHTTGSVTLHEIQDGCVIFPETGFGRYSVAQADVETVSASGTLEDHLGVVTSLEENVPYIIACADKNWVLTNTAAEKTDSQGRVHKGLLLDGEPSLTTEHIWYYTNNTVIYGSVDNTTSYLQISYDNYNNSFTSFTDPDGYTGNVALGAYKSSRAAYVSLNSDGKTFSIQRPNASLYLNRYGGTSSDNVATTWYQGGDSTGASRWYFYKVYSSQEVSLTVTPSQNTVMTNGTVILTPTVLIGESSTDKYTLTWGSGDESVATVDANGVVTPVNSGQVVIIATLTAVDGVSVEDPIVVEIPITVVDASRDATTVTTTTVMDLLGEALTLTEGTDSGPYILLNHDTKWQLSGNIGATGYDGRVGLELLSNLDMRHIWYVDADENGNTYLRYGASNGDYLVFEDGLVSLMDGSTDLSAIPDNVDLFDKIDTHNDGDSYAMYSSTFWSSWNAVNHYGGEPYIAAGRYPYRNNTSCYGGSYWYFYEAIIDASVSLTVSPSKDVLYPGEKVTLTPTVTLDRSARTDYSIEWTSSDTSAATVDANGKVTAVSGGNVVITATLFSVDGLALDTPISVEIQVKMVSVATDSTSSSASVRLDPYLRPVTAPEQGKPYVIEGAYNPFVILTGEYLGKSDPGYNGHNSKEGLRVTLEDDYDQLWYYDGTHLQFGTTDATNNYLIYKDDHVMLGELGSGTGDFDLVQNTGGSTYRIGISAIEEDASNAGSAKRYLNHYGGGSKNVAWVYDDIYDGGGTNWYFNEAIQEQDAKLTVSPASGAILVDGTVNFKAALTLDGVATTDYTLTWSSADDSIASVYKGKVTGKSSGTVDITATVTAIQGKTLDEPLYVTVPVTVYGIQSVTISSNEATVPQLSSVNAKLGQKLAVTYEDGTIKHVPVTVGMLTDTEGNKINTKIAGVYSPLTVTYDGIVATSGFTLTVEEVELDDYPAYPNEGSVQVDKTGTGIDFQASGLAKVELSATGVPSKTGVDVIIMLDTSSSMTNAVGDPDSNLQRIHVLTASLNELITSFQSKGPDGTTMDIRVAVADFNGYYFDPESPYYIDANDTTAGNSIRTTAERDVVYTGSKDLSAGAFVDVHGLGENPFTSSGYTGTTSGTHQLSTSSGTNYDYAFDAVYQLGEAVNDQNAENGEDRDLFVVFMSDGAPFQYNYFSSQSSNVYSGTTYWNNWLLGTMTDGTDGTVDMFGPNSNRSYYNPDGKHWMAEAIKGSRDQEYPVIRKNDERDEDGDNWINVQGLGATMYSIGFCLKVDVNVTVESMDTVIRNIASNEDYYFRADTAEELDEAFNKISNDIFYAATGAHFIDTMGPEFDIQLGDHAYIDGNNVQQTIKPVIQYRTYTIYTMQDVEDGLCTLDQVGTRKLDADGNEIYVLNEEVSFNADGTEAYSNVLGSDVNILVDGVICAKNFWYNTNAVAKTITLDDGSTYSLPAETFYWKLGIISTTEQALSYYVYLTKSLEGERAGGTYDTNTHAELFYTNYLGNPCSQEVPTPKLPWQQALLGYGFYLVNSDGKPVVNVESGQIGSFQKAVRFGDVTYQDFLWNDGAQSITASILTIPTGYALYDQSAKYDVSLNSNGIGYYTIYSDESVSDSTMVTGINSTYVTGGTAAGEKVDTTGYATAATVVWFALVAVEDPLTVDKTVEKDGDDFMLTLEAYANGETTQVTAVEPADIVLVLDQSSSMYTPLGWDKDRVNLEGGDTYSAINSKLSSYKISDFVTQANTAGSDIQENAKRMGYYIAVHNSGNYMYLVHYAKVNDTWGWYYISIDQTTRSIGLTAADYASPSNDSSLGDLEYKLCQWDNGAVFTGFSYYKTQYGALVESVESFVNDIAASGVDHRIGIVGFASPFYDGWDHYDGSGLYVDGQFYLYDTDFMYKGWKNDDGTYHYDESTCNFVESTWTGASASNTYILDPNTSFLDSPDIKPLADSVLTDAYAHSIILKDASGNPTGGTMYGQALSSVQTDLDGIKASVAAINANYQQTCPSVGIEMAEQIFAARSAETADRDKIIVLFTDGVPTVRLLSNRHHGYTDDINTKALYWSISGGVEDALDRAVEAKTNGVQIYTIGTAAMENVEISGTNIDSGDFLNYLSSNYAAVTYGVPFETMIQNDYPTDGYGGHFDSQVGDPDTSHNSDTKTRYYTYYDATTGDGTSDDFWAYYYRVAPDLINTRTDFAQFAAANTGESGTDLNLAFDSIMSSITEPSVKLDRDDILRDVLSDYFDLKTSGSTPLVEVYTAAMNADGTFQDPVLLSTAVVTYDMSDPDSGRLDIINVQGYSYMDEYLSTTPRDRNGADYYGSKLIVKIPIVVRDGFWGGNDVPTNENATAIYDVTFLADNKTTEDVVTYFPIPEVNVPVSPIISADDQVIYYGEETISNDDVFKGITIAGKEIEVVYSETDGFTFQNVDDGMEWADDYATLEWASNSDTTETEISNATPDTYSFDIVLKPKDTNVSSTVGTPMPTAGNAASAEGTVTVLVPVLTFRDSTILKGKETDKYYYDNTNYLGDEQVKWVDMSTYTGGTATDISSTVTLGTEPTLKLEYTPEGTGDDTFTVDTDVDVTVILHNQVINDVAWFQWQSCSSSLHDEATISTHKANADQEEFWIHVSSIGDDPNGLVTNKTVSPVVGADDQFLIELEAYATGEIKEITTVKPADIILVLDHSGSMRTPAGATQILYSPNTETGYTGDLYGELGKTDKGQLTKGQLDAELGAHMGYYVAQSSTTKAWFVLQYEPSTAKWVGYSVPSTESIVNKTGWTEHTFVQRWSYDELPTQLVYYKSQYAMLYDSVLSFVQELHRSGVEHNVSIVGFAGHQTYGTRLYVGGNEEAYKSYYSQLYHENTSQTRREELYIKAMKNVADTTEYNELLSLVEAIDTNYSHTCPAAGIQLANEVLAANPVDLTERDRIVVLFTDGIPNRMIGQSSTDTGAEATEIRNEIIDQAYISKQTHGAKFYSISTSTTGDVASDRLFLNYSSSDYPNATSMTSTGSAIAGAPKFTKEVSSTKDLMDAFGTVTNQFTSTTVTLDDTTLLVEILSDYFELLNDGAKGDDGKYLDVRVYKVPFDGTGDWKEKEILSTAVIELGSTDVADRLDKVIVSGYDYSKEYISDKSRQYTAADGTVIAEYYGSKLLVEVDIVTIDGFWGGEDVPTNDAATGLYPNKDTDEPVEYFPVPDTDVAPDIIVEDTVVIDYGLSVDIDVMKEHTVVFGQNEILGFVDAIPSKNFAKIDPTYATNKYTNTGSFGALAIQLTDEAPNGTVRYTLSRENGMQMNTKETFYYVGLYTADDGSEYYYYGKVTVIPATVMYFEEDFLDFTVNNDLFSNWTPVYETDKETDADKPTTTIQDEDRPGEEGVIYGYDSHYTSSPKYSLGVAQMVNVFKNGNGEKTATATFKFRGTGFDVVSLTSNTSGTILVNVYALDESGNKIDQDTSTTQIDPYTSYMVDTYYGYCYGPHQVTQVNDKGEEQTVTVTGWYVSPDNTPNAIYQIPVIKAEDLPYGFYEAEIYAAYNSWFDHDQYADNSYDFYLDAIRIYDPANDGAEDTTIQQAYKDDSEAWPTYDELRDMLLPVTEVEALLDSIDDLQSQIDDLQAQLDALEEGADSTEIEEQIASLEAQILDKKSELAAEMAKNFQGAIFIDGKKGEMSVSDYTHYGPNNELYLEVGQSIYFEVDTTDTNIASVHLSMKSLGGTAYVQLYSNGEPLDPFTIGTSTDLYYDVTGLGKVMISNIGTGEGEEKTGAILSITNVKITYNADPYGTSGTLESGPFNVSGGGLHDALAMLSATETVTQPTLTLKYPSLSFEEEIRYNVYFTASDIQDVVEMGLITFGSELTDGTIENALDVIPGYVTNGEMFMVSSNGIAARDMGDDLYFKVYAKLSDGSYVYTDLKSYSAVAYATTILGRETSSDASKALVVALLKYGAAAQSYFGDEGVLMDASLTAEQLALIGAYEDLTIADPITPDASKTAAFVKNGFIKGMPSVSFDGIFTINYYFYPEHEVQGDMKLYYWDVDTYESVEELTVENASGYITMVATDDGAYCGSYSDIAAKEIEQTMFVAAVYECDGVTYTTNVIGYSLAAYCKTIAAKETSDMKDLAKATAVYGYYAGAYFTEA